MQDLNGVFVRNLISASMISWRSKQSMGTVMCLSRGQETISTFLWGCGAAASDDLRTLLKREEYRHIDYPRLTSAPRERRI